MSGQIQLGNKSLIWGQLALPDPAAGAIPFVDQDDLSIAIDPLNFYYDQNTQTLHVTNGTLNSFTNLPVPGTAGVANTTSGRFILAAGQGQYLISCNQVAIASVVHLQIETRDATAFAAYVTPSGGLITVDMNQVATGNVTMTFAVLG